MPCRRCGLEPDGHPASQCLNEWVHEQFLGHALSEDNAAGVPNYSAERIESGLSPNLDDLTDAERWPPGSRCRTARGLWLVETPEVGLASAESLSLAVCRAALKVP